MKLEKIYIKNFRSIKECTIQIDKKYHILVGINEAGKSNLLKAISLINSDIPLSKNDIRDPGFDEDNTNDSFIRFIFKLSESELNHIIKIIKDKTLAKNKDEILLTIGENDNNLKDFVKFKSDVLYVANLITEERYTSHFKLEGPKFRIKSEWKKLISKEVVEINGKKHDLSNFLLINIKDYPDIQSVYYEDLDITKLNSLVGTFFTEHLKQNIPDSILWKYSPSNLLPGRINFSGFKQNPDSSLPLKIMFNLSGIDNISESLENAEAKTNGIKNIFKRISENTTAHMKKVWPEWNKLTISITQNGEYIEAGIQDEFNFYSLERRSDGFKRFFTFLLMISGQNKTEELRDNIILIDEPEIGIHPSGQQFLTNELEKISKNNIVFIATHSIFMIDKEHIDRHLIVKKTKEVTNIEIAGESNINDEEVLYKALGFSIFELLKPVNIIFEGWRDKKFFEIFCHSRKFKEEIGIPIKNIGLLHALGVKDIQRISNMCENFNRQYIIISDSDLPALEKKKSFEGTGLWYTYSDIENIDAVTTEDFIKKELVNKIIKKIFNENCIESDFILDDEINRNYIEIIATFLKDQKIHEYKTIINEIKELLINNLKAEDIDDKYFDVVKKISNV